MLNKKDWNILQRVMKRNPDWGCIVFKKDMTLDDFTKRFL
jgi:hypothetical protein